MPKKGKKSVGVTRQWCGQLGKTDNCQVGVYTTLCSGENYAPIGFRLYLPQSWVDDKARCKEAGIADESIEFFTKPELAIQLVIEARMHGVEFEWISVDSLYGKDPALLRMMDQMDEVFMADVAKNQSIYLEDPDPVVPARKSESGRKPSKLKAQCEPIRDGRISSQEMEKLASPYGNGIDGHVVHAGTTPAVQRRLSVIELLRYCLHPKLFTSSQSDHIGGSNTATRRKA